MNHKSEYLKKAYDEFYPGTFTAKNLHTFFEEKSPITVRRILTKLVERGYLERERNSYHDPYHYKITDKGVYFVESGMWKRSRDRFREKLRRGKERVARDWKEKI